MTDLLSEVMNEQSLERRVRELERQVLDIERAPLDLGEQEGFASSAVLWDAGSLFDGTDDDGTVVVQHVWRYDLDRSQWQRRVKGGDDTRGGVTFQMTRHPKHNRRLFWGGSYDPEDTFSLYRSDNDGRTLHILANPPDYFLNSFAIDAGGRIWGQFASGNVTGFLTTVSMFYSDNRGDSWTKSADLAATVDAQNFFGVTATTLDSTDRIATVCLGTSDILSLYVTTDRGGSWSELPLIPSATAYEVQSPAVAASARVVWLPNGKLVCSYRQGENFHLVLTSVDGGTIENDYTFDGVARSVRELICTSRGVVYACLTFDDPDDASLRGGILRSTDGSSWTASTIPADDFSPAVTGLVFLERDQSLYVLRGTTPFSATSFWRVNKNLTSWRKVREKDGVITFGFSSLAKDRPDL